MYTDFGDFVRSLRQLRLFDSGNGLKQWTQEHLAKEMTRLTSTKKTFSKLQIARIEQGKTKNLHPFIAPLAEVFQLNEGEKEKFYALAGLYYRNEREPTEVKDEINRLFQEIDYPAFARTPLWDFIAFNKHHYELWGYTPERIKLLKKKPLGPNVLKVLFEPAFDNKTYKGGDVMLSADIARSIEAFRFESFTQINTPRFSEIIDALQKYPEFSWRWNTNEPSLNNKPVPPISKIHHPTYGYMEFLSLRTPEKYLGASIDISIYVPLAKSLAQFQQLQVAVQSNRNLLPVYDF